MEQTAAHLIERLDLVRHPDFEMGNRDDVLKQFPDHTEIILRMCAVTES